MKQALFAFGAVVSAKRRTTNGVLRRWPWDLDGNDPEDSRFGPRLFIRHGGDALSVGELLDELGKSLDELELKGRKMTATTKSWPVTDISFRRGISSAGPRSAVPAGANRPTQLVSDRALQWCQPREGEFQVRFGSDEYRVLPADRSQLLETAFRGKGSSVSHVLSEHVRSGGSCFRPGNDRYSEGCPGIEDRGTWRTGLSDMAAALDELTFHGLRHSETPAL